MITSDGISETVSALLSWLSTAESYLSDTKPVLGDVETVSMLMQQHQACTAFFVLSFGLITGNCIFLCINYEKKIGHR